LAQGARPELLFLEQHESIMCVGLKFNPTNHQNEWHDASLAFGKEKKACFVRQGFPTLL
jgi:hypothetical protein